MKHNLILKAIHYLELVAMIQENVMIIMILCDKYMVFKSMNYSLDIMGLMYDKFRANVVKLFND